MSSSHYPSHWWSYVISGCIFLSCCALLYWKIVYKKSCYEFQYISIDDHESKPKDGFTRTPTIQSSGGAVLKTLLRLEEQEDDEDGFAISRQNTSVISVGTFQAKQSSLYQSFMINNEMNNNQYHFTQLSSYTPSTKRHKINNDERIETMKQMCNAHKNGKTLFAEYEAFDSEDDIDDNLDIL